VILTALKREDSRRLREEAIELIYRAVEEDDREKAQQAVVAYALSKLVSKHHIVGSPQWPSYKKLLLQAVEEGLPPERIAGIIANIDEELGNFVYSLLDKARLKMAAYAYAAGLSIRRAVELTGADFNELVDYIGKTTIHDEEEYKISLTDRVNGLRRLLG